MSVPPGRAVMALPTLVLHAVVAVAYLWFATAATFEVEPGGHFYELLGDAFLAGQLHLQAAPSPELLGLPDPYDSQQNRPYRLQDASLYEGKYYLYWGPVPGLAHALWKGITGRPTSTMLFQVLLGVGGYLWFWLLARTLRNVAFPHIPGWSVNLVALCYALGGVGPFLQGRAIIHHEAFLWASFFLLAACYWWVRGLADERGSLWKLALAGVLFGCAFGSRTTLVCYAAAAGLVLAASWLRAPRDRGAFRRVLAFGLPSSAALLLLALYNQARFDSPLEFGQGYLLSGYRQDPKWSLTFIPYNLAAYLLLIPELILYFPFQYSPRPPEWFRTETWSLEHPISSILLVAPLAILAPLAIWAAVRRPDRAAPVVRAVAVGGGIGTLGAFALLLIWNSASGRYLQDVLPMVCLLGVVGLWQLQHPRWQPLSLARLGHGALSVLVFVGSLAGGLSYGLTHLSVTHHDEYGRLAYQFDRAATRVMRRIRPDLWQETYITPEVRDRPGGFFYVGQSVVVLPVVGDEPIQALTVESFFPDERQVRIEIDGREVGKETVGEGQQLLRLDEDVIPRDADRATLRMTLTDREAEFDRSLWPLRVVGLGPLRPDPRLAIEQPQPGAIVAQPFQVSGWAVDLGAEGTGVDAVAVWARPIGGGPATPLGLATYGMPRPGVGEAHGSRFTNSGYVLAVDGLPPGEWELVVSTSSSLSDEFTNSRPVTVTVR